MSDFLKYTRLDKIFNVTLFPESPDCRISFEWCTLSHGASRAIYKRNVKMVKGDEQLDQDKYFKEIVAAHIKGWSGMTPSAIAEFEILPLDADGIAAWEKALEGSGGELPFSATTAYDLVRESTKLATRIGEYINAETGLDKVQAAREAYDRFFLHGGQSSGA